MRLQSSSSRISDGSKFDVTSNADWSADITGILTEGNEPGQFVASNKTGTGSINAEFGGKSAFANISVFDPVKNYLRLVLGAKNNLTTLNIGQSNELRLIGIDPNGKRIDLTASVGKWESSNQNALAIDPFINGGVFAQAKGDAKITAYFKGQIANLDMSVTADLFSGFQFIPGGPINLSVGGSEQLGAAIMISGGAPVNITNDADCPPCKITSMSI